jgi:hypothetical protein
MTLPLIQNKLTTFPNDNSYWLIYKTTHFTNTSDHDMSPKKSKRFHKVIEGDIIKIGRIYMKIWKICSDSKDSFTREYKTYNMKRSFSYVGLNSNSSNSSIRSAYNSNTLSGNNKRNNIITYNRNYSLQPMNNNNNNNSNKSNSNKKDNKHDKVIVLPRLLSIEASRKYKKLKLKPFQRNTKDSEVNNTKSK